jgi:putative ABC transport system permease protein
MRKRPGFTALVIATLALGIGVNTTSVAVAYGILVRPLPYTEPSRIVILNLRFADGGELGFSPPVLQDWLPRLRTVESAAGYYRRDVTVQSAGRSAVVPAAFVTERFFDLLGTPVDSGQASAIDARVVVSRRWLAQFVPGEPSAMVGRPVAISRDARTIIGVMPADFAFPDDEIALWLPSRALIQGTTSENTGYSKIVARLKPGVTIEQVRADLDRIRREIDGEARSRGGDPVQTIASANALGESVVGGLRTLLIATLAGSLMVLLVACANVATLFIGRDVARARELAVRLATGATAGQLIRRVLVESLLTASIASLIGVALGAGLLQLFVTQATASVSGLHRVTMGAPVALAIVVLTLVVALACAAVPAWRAGRADFSPFDSLRSLRASSSPRVWRVRGALVVSQIALSCVLLVGAGLLTRTVSVLMRQDHGFLPDGALEAKLVLSDKVLSDTAGQGTFVRDLLERVRQIPGVQYAGFGANLPPRPPLFTMLTRMTRDGRDEERFLSVGTATPGYFRALGARFVRGRDFDEAESRSRTAVVILSESTARFIFKNDDPIGRPILRLPSMFGVTGNARVVGVVSDMRYEGLDSPPSSALYVPWDLRPAGRGYLVARLAGGDPMRAAPEIRRVVSDLDASIPVPELQSLNDVLSRSIANRRVRALPAVGFGLLALCVAFVGVLATLSTLVAERRRDLAIRAALGASPRGLAWTVVGPGLMLTMLGLATGLGLGAVVARLISSLIYGVSAYDALTFAGTAVAIGGGATLMTYAAATRARRVDPLVLLKSE